MSPAIPHLYACVLAGGSGQRFWPLSRELNPKQLLSMFGTESLIAQAVHRILPLTAGGEAVFLVTNERSSTSCATTSPRSRTRDLHRLRYLKEPIARNTAPAIALAAATLVAEDPDAVMVVLPSDHLLEDGDLWRECIESGVKLANGGYLVDHRHPARRVPRPATATSRPPSRSSGSRSARRVPHRVERVRREARRRARARVPRRRRATSGTPASSS